VRQRLRSQTILLQVHFIELRRDKSSTYFSLSDSQVLISLEQWRSFQMSAYTLIGGAVTWNNWHVWG